MPTFVLGLSLIWIFAYKLSPVTQFFPFHGYVPITSNPGQWFEYLILPWLTLAMVTAAALHPADPDLHARCAGRGLHQHREVEGHAGSGG